VKIYANALALSILLALLVACGDESSSSVSPEPRQCEEQSDDCDNVSSSSEKISKNSSSSQKSADKGKSSSSEKNAKESSSSATNKNSSSSVDGDKSSSSVKKEDSSSSAVKASSSSVTPKSSSSEEVKQTSSSDVASSSSVKSSSSVSPKSSSSEKENPWGTDAEWNPFNCNAFGGCLEFTDSRDNRTYKYLKFEGKNSSIYAMVENLNVGDMVRGYKDQQDDSKIERYCYDNDTLNCHYYGGLYQWAEMMQLPSECNAKSCADLIKPNHQGICPNGWRLMTATDFEFIVKSNGNTHGVEGTRSTFGFGGYNTTGFSLVGAGYNWNHSFDELGKSTYWHYPQEGTLGELSSFVGCQGSTTTTICEQSTLKTHGFSVRCVMVE